MSLLIKINGSTESRKLCLCMMQSNSACVIDFWQLSRVVCQMEFNGGKPVVVPHWLSTICIQRLIEPYTLKLGRFCLISDTKTRRQENSGFAPWIPKAHCDILSPWSCCLQSLGTWVLFLGGWWEPIPRADNENHFSSQILTKPELAKMTNWICHPFVTSSSTARETTQLVWYCATTVNSRLAFTLQLNKQKRTPGWKVDTNSLLNTRIGYVNPFNESTKNFFFFFFFFSDCCNVLLGNAVSQHMTHSRSCTTGVGIISFSFQSKWTCAQIIRIDDCLKLSEKPQCHNTGRVPPILSLWVIQSWRKRTNLVCSLQTCFQPQKSFSLFLSMGT